MKTKQTQKKNVSMKYVEESFKRKFLEIVSFVAGLKWDLHEIIAIVAAENWTFAFSKVICLFVCFEFFFLFNAENTIYNYERTTCTTTVYPVQSK